MFETTIMFSPGLSAVALEEPSVAFVPSPCQQPSVPNSKPCQEPRPTLPQHHEFAQSESLVMGGETRHLEAIRANLEELSQRLFAQQRQRLSEMQQVAVQLATCMATCLVQHRFESDGAILDNLVRKAIHFLEPHEAVTVFLHPLDLALLQTRWADQVLPDSNVDLRLEADHSLNRGDCRAETGDMAVISNWKARLEAIGQELLLGLPEAEVERRAPHGEPCLRRFPDRRQRA